MGKLDFKEIPHYINQVYRSYFELFSIKSPQLTSSWYINDEKIVRLLLAAASIMTVSLLCYVFITSFKKKFLMVNIGLSIFIFLFPIAVLIVYFMSNNQTAIYLIMLYSIVFAAIVPVVLIDTLYGKLRKKWMVFCLWGVTLISAGLIFCWGNLANRTYLAMQLRHECVKTYYTTLITQIKQTEGYRPEYPVAFVGKLNDPGLTDFNKFGNKNIMRVADADPELFINTYPSSQERFIRNYYGYNFTRAENTDEISRSQAFIGMNTYPIAGSIKIINDTVVVKFSDP